VGPSTIKWLGNLPFWVQALLGAILGGLLIFQGVRSHPANWPAVAFGAFLVIGPYLVELRKRRKKRGPDFSSF
jgi:hypothetical protein